MYAIDAVVRISKICDKVPVQKYYTENRMDSLQNTIPAIVRVRLAMIIIRFTHPITHT